MHRHDQMSRGKERGGRASSSSNIHENGKAVRVMMLIAE